MGEVDDGGPAFPIEGGPNSMLLPAHGLSKRDWFAGMALARMQGEVRPFDHKNNYRMIAEAAFDISDAMIKAGEGDK